MNVKKFSILTAVIVGVMLIVTIVLGCVTVNVPVSSTPDQFIVYNSSTDSTGVTYDNDQRPSKYNKLCKLYKNMTKLSIFDYMLKGQAVTKMPTQDLEGENGSWVDSNKKDYVCLEVIFNETQNVIVEVDGNTKAIGFTSLIMKVEKSVACHQVVVYFSNATGSYRTYKANPILVYAKQNKLLKYINTLNDGTN